LKKLDIDRHQKIKNALQLGRRDFQIAKIRNRFWSALQFPKAHGDTSHGLV